MYINKMKQERVFCNMELANEWKDYEILDMAERRKA